MVAQWTEHSPTISEARLINPRGDTVRSSSLLLVHTLAREVFLWFSSLVKNQHL